LSLRDGPLGDIKVPLTWSAAAAIVIAVIIAAAFLLSRQHDPLKAGAYDTARRAVDVVEAPVGGALSAPVRWSGSAVDYVRDYFFAISENRQLKAELVRARESQQQLEAMQVENARLRAVLGIRTDPPLPHVVAETIADSRGPFANTRLANVGQDKGVTEGNPVISQHGLIGRIVGVSAHVSRVLMLTDAESRTPVLLVRTNGRAILSGDGGEAPKLSFVRSSLQLKEGDRVMTSGDGGVFPRGLPVGTVVRGLDGGWHVALDSDAAPIDYVQILLFTDFSQLAVERALAPKDLPTAMTEEPSPSIVGPTTSAPIAAKPAAAKPGAPAAATVAGAAKPGAAASLAPKIAGQPKVEKPKSALSGAASATPKPGEVKAGPKAGAGKPKAAAAPGAKPAAVKSPKPPIGEARPSPAHPPKPKPPAEAPPPTSHASDIPL
jgi:rod shape-determining protein MreC